MATPPGLEPNLNGPKPLVLPLHHGVATQRDNNIALFFDFSNSFYKKNGKIPIVTLKTSALPIMQKNFQFYVDEKRLKFFILEPYSLME